MTPTDLLIPRYKVIADYPGRRFEIGKWYYPNDHTFLSRPEAFFENYPHLFRKLEWWEERRPEDMPEYVKSGKRVFKALTWANTAMSTGRRFVPAEPMPQGFMADAYFCQPATAEEYAAYLATQTTTK